LTFGDFEVPNFHLLSGQNSDDEIEQKAQAKNTKKTSESSGLSEILRKFFAKGKTGKGQALLQVY